MKNSESKEQEVERNVAIILVIGTSSAGKSVLINKIKALDELRPEGERINWDENGVDMEGPRQWAALDPAREDSQFKSLLTHTVNEDGNRGKFTQSEVDGLILDGTLLVGDAIISLSDKGVDIGKFRQSLSIEDQSKYTEESILKLQNLTENYHSLYEDTVERVSNVKVMEAIFARAVENSKKGIPSLLDVVPWDYYDVMGKFKEYTSSHGLSNVSSVVVAHCDIAQLTEHMDQRNAKADVEERRDTTTPFKQYADMYQTCKEGEDGIGSFTVQNVVDAVEKFGKKSDSKELEPGFLPQEVQDLLTKLEVPAEEWSLLDKPIKVTTREAYSSYDLLCQTDEKSGIGITSTIAIDDIVKDIDGIVSKALERESELERRSEEISEQENKLANQYRSQISKQCFDKFFSEEAISSGVEEKSGDDGPTPKFILNTFILHEALQHSQQAKALLPVGEIKSQEDLDKIFKHVGLEHLRSIDRDCLDGVNNLTILPKLEFQSSGLAPNTSQTLEQHINESSFFGDIHISQGNSTHKAHSADIADNTPFCILSVGKVPTGILVVKILQESILTEAQLDKTVELDEEVVGQLPPLVQERLKSTTLRQLMTHQSGLTDYLSGYTQAIEDGLDGKGEVPNIQRPEDYLKFAEDSVVDLKKGETNYSNLGSLLTGLAIQTAYNKKHPDNRLSYNQILKEKILDPAGIKQFSIQNPGNGSTNPNDRTAPHLCGGPAGGYWTTAQDLDRFGKWVCQEWKKPEFRELVEKHGQEFYDPKQKSIGHNGGIASASANLQIFPEENLVSVVLASRPQAAFQANRAIVRQFQENLNIESNKMKELEAKEKQPQVQAGNLNAVEAARNFKDIPEIIERYTIFNPRNVYRSAAEVLELHDATGVDIMPRGNATNPGDIIGVGLICFRPERIAKQLTVASVNMQAKIDEESFPRIVDDVFDNYVAKEMEVVVPQVNQMRAEIERNVAEASKALQENPEINTDGNAVLTKVKEARDKIRQKAEGKIPPVSEELINDTAAKYATDLLYNESPEIFKLVEDAVARGMEQAAKEGKYEPLSRHQNNERVAIVVAGGPASGKTQATEIALHSLEDSRDVMAFSTDQLRTLVSPGETGGPAFTDLEANLVFRQIIGKMDRAMKSDVAPTILSEGTSLNPGAINHLLTGGAQVHASLISIPAEVALERAGKRAASDKAADQGRSYSDEYLLGLHKQDGTALPNITNQLQGKNVQLSIFDNNVERGQSPELIGRMNLQTMEMEIYNVQKLAELEQKGKIDPTQSKDRGMYSADDKLPENNISFLTDALKKFSVTFRDGEMGEEYATSKPGEKLTITNQALFDSKQQNPYDKALTSPLLEEIKKAEQEQKSGDSWVKKLGFEDKAEKPRSFLEAAQAGKYGNIGSKGGAHEL